MNNRQIDKKTTKQIRIDTGLHQLLKIYAAESRMTIKTLLEDYLSDLLAVDKDGVYKTKSRKPFSFGKQTDNVPIMDKTGAKP